MRPRRRPARPPPCRAWKRRGQMPLRALRRRRWSRGRWNYASACIRTRTSFYLEASMEYHINQVYCKDYFILLQVQFESRAVWTDFAAFAWIQLRRLRQRQCLQQQQQHHHHFNAAASAEACLSQCSSASGCVKTTKAETISGSPRRPRSPQPCLRPRTRPRDHVSGERT